jgi:hypothetical protein
MPTEQTISESEPRRQLTTDSGKGLAARHSSAAKPLTAVSTEPSGPLPGNSTDPPRTSSTNVISEVSGVVLGKFGDFVRIKLGTEVVVDFPEQLIDSSLAQRGMPIKYQIKRRPDGTRYQDFVGSVPQGSPETLEELETLLKKF